MDRLSIDGGVSFRRRLHTVKGQPIAVQKRRQSMKRRSQIRQSIAVSAVLMVLLFTLRAYFMAKRRRARQRRRQAQRHRTG